MRTRPAETTAASAALALIIAYLLGVRDADLILAFSVVIGVVPAAVTWLVNLLRPAPKSDPAPPNLEF